MDERVLDRIIDFVLVLCRGYGWDILRTPGNLRRYLREQFRSARGTADACMDVIETDGIVDTLMWIRYLDNEPHRRDKCVESYALSIEQSGVQDAKTRADVFRRFAVRSRNETSDGASTY